MADTETNQLIIYVGTQAKINQARQQGQIGNDDFAVVTDAPDYALASDLQTETTNRTNADNNLQQQIDAISASSDVTDIVGTYAELQAYDTTKLKDNDIIKVLQDETEDGATTYYRWSTHTHTFTLIGEEGPYYTKSQADEEFVPQTRTVNGKALSNNITLDASDVGALPNSTVIPTVNNATLTIQQNGTTVATFTANSSTNQTANISVPTDTNDLTNGAGFITSSALSGYATENWVANQGYITGINSSDVKNALGYTPADENDIPTANDYWTVGTNGVFDQQTTYSRKLIKYSADFGNQGQNQQNGFRVIGNESADTSNYDTSGYWLSRVMFGTNKRTFLMGVTKNTRKNPATYMCGIGAHSWTDAESQTGAAWEDVYIQPDGNKATYIGGKGWEVNSGWFKVQNSGNLTGGTVQVNRNSIDSPTWKDVACWDDNVSKFNNDAGYITGITSSMITTALGFTPIQMSDATFTIYRGE